MLEGGTVSAVRRFGPGWNRGDTVRDFGVVKCMVIIAVKNLLLKILLSLVMNESFYRIAILCAIYKWTNNSLLA